MTWDDIFIFSDENFLTSIFHVSFLADSTVGFTVLSKPEQELLDPDIWEFIVKYNLDDRVMNRLIETLNNPKRKGKSKDTLQVGGGVAVSLGQAVNL